MTATTAAPVLVDQLPAHRLRDVTTIAGSLALLWAAGNVMIPLPLTPVPLSLATFSVLLLGAALGPGRAAITTGLYLVLGVVGVPMFAGGASGWAFASFGYVLGYLAAAVLVGQLARRRQDRSFGRTALLALAGTSVIYLLGVPWLMGFLRVDLLTALQLGVFPFLIGDAVKAVAAALVLPSAWRLIGHR